MPAERLGDKT